LIAAAATSRRLRESPGPAPLATGNDHARRVTLLIMAIILMSVADLVITLTYMRSVGMFEANPIARFMVSLGSYGHLVRYKLFTMALSCGLLYLLRRHRNAELAAWLCAIVLLSLTAHWVRYNNQIVNYTNELLIAQEYPGLGMFVHIPDEAPAITRYPAGRTDSWPW